MGLRQIDLGRKAGLSIANGTACPDISAFERGRKRPGPTTVARLAAALGCTENDLLGDAIEQQAAAAAAAADKIVRLEPDQLQRVVSRAIERLDAQALRRLHIRIRA